MSLPIAFAPGLACTRELFSPVIAGLPGHDSIIVDATQDETLAAMAARFLESAPERFALAGLSMGGYLALEIIRQAPGRVDRLALLDTSARPDSEEASQRRRALMALARSGDLDAVHEVLWPRLVHEDRRDDAALEEVVRTMLHETGVEAFIRQQRAIMGRMDSRPTLGAIACPALVLVGEDDAITPPAMAYEMADAIADAELDVITDCGHLATLERPDAVTRALERWLRA
jgi:pimeloyl-ACP methyl ester carboxylesterase